MDLVKVGEHLWVPKDFDKNHAYYADSLGKKPYTGITSVISVLAKPALIGWAARMATEYIDGKSETNQGMVFFQEDEWGNILAEAKVAHTKKKEAAGTHGTDVHALVEKYIGSCISLTSGSPLAGVSQVFRDKKDSEAIDKFISWAYENVDHFLFSERRMVDPSRFIAGTADFAYIGKDGKRYMGDFKTSSGVYGIDYWMQVAGYRLLAEVEGDQPYDGSAVIRLGKDGSFEALYRYDYETDRNAFLACLTLYRAQATYKTSKRKRG